MSNDQSSEALLRCARNFEATMGRDNIPFLIAIWNDETERIEFVTNLGKEHMVAFVHDISDQVEHPDVFETYQKNAGLQ